jgi:hypothetical protein
MNQFTDDQYDRVCDENEKLRVELSIARTQIEELTIERDKARKYAQVDRIILLTEDLIDAQVERNDARDAARFCWSCGCQDIWKTYREEAMKKWPWIDSDEDPS